MVGLVRASASARSDIYEVIIGTNFHGLLVSQFREVTLEWEKS